MDFASPVVVDKVSSVDLEVVSLVSVVPLSRTSVVSSSWKVLAPLKDSSSFPCSVLRVVLSKLPATLTGNVVSSEVMCGAVVVVGVVNEVVVASVGRGVVPIEVVAGVVASVASVPLVSGALVVDSTMNRISVPVSTSPRTSPADLTSKLSSSAMESPSRVFIGTGVEAVVVGATVVANSGAGVVGFIGQWKSGYFSLYAFLGLGFLLNLFLTLSMVCRTSQLSLVAHCFPVAGISYGFSERWDMLRSKSPVSTNSVLRILRLLGVGVGRLSFLNLRRGTATVGAAALIVVSATAAVVVLAVMGALVLNRILGLGVVSEGPLLLLLSWFAA